MAVHSLKNESFRAFLALPLASLFQSEITPFIQQAQREFPEIRWVRPDQIHITLHFFGSIDRPAVTRIKQVVEPITQAVSKFKVSLEKWGCFPNPDRPRVIWLGMGGEIERLSRLHSLIERALEKAHFPVETRSFKPHLTVGRMKQSNRKIELNRLHFDSTAQKELSEMVLFQSHLSPSGARYETIETFPFSKA